jgi:hypothetical protein
MARLFAALLVLATSCTHSKAPEVPPGSTTDHPVTTEATREPAPGKGTAPALVPDGGSPTAEPSPETLPSKVRIFIRAVPAKAKLKVYWGKKLLGVTPLNLDRPRDSGPMDLVVRGDGAFPLHTRVYTYKNETLYVKLTKLEDKMKLLGAREELPPPETTPEVSPAVNASPDAGVR